MSRINVENIRHPDAASDSLQLSDTGNITAPGNLSVTGTSTLTDDLTVDTNTLFVDASTNRVGVGLTSPESLLHVESSSETIVTIEGNNAPASAGGVLVLKNNDTTANNLNQIQGADAGGQTCSAISFVNVDQANNEGELRFLTRPSSGTPTEVLRLTSNGTLQLRNSPGIDFSQIQTNAAGMTSETLDSYEEGTWTPSYSAAFTGSYATNGQIGRYTKVGRIVTAYFFIQVSSVSGSGGFTLDGLPFATASATNYNPGAVISLAGNWSTNTPFSLDANGSGATTYNIKFRSSANGSIDAGNIAVSDLATNAFMRGVIVYETA